VPAVVLTRGDAVRAATRFSKLPTSGWSAKHKLSNLFFCKSSSQLHLCSSVCAKSNAIFLDGQLTCRISGRVLGTERVAAYITVYAQRQKSLSIDPYLFRRDGSGSVDFSRSSLLRVATNAVHTLLFSKQRQYFELSKLKLLKKLARKKIAYFLKLCKVQGRIVIYTDLLRINAFAMGRPRVFVGLTPSQETARALESVHAHRILQIWNKLTKHTEMSKFSENVPYFATFCISVLYLQKTGLAAATVQILQRDRFLEHALPEASNLCYYGIVKNAFTNCKNAIRAALRTVVEEGQLSPQMFVVL
tara:strand:+ start:268 stop:1179 length:912 start_codon:yes stop_codon:yes gene_type:complete